MYPAGTANPFAIGRSFNNAGRDDIVDRRRTHARGRDGEYRHANVCVVHDDPVIAAILMPHCAEAFIGRYQDHALVVRHAAQAAVERHIHFKIRQSASQRLPGNVTAHVVFHFFHGEQIILAWRTGFGNNHRRLGGAEAAALGVSHVVHHLVIAVPDFAAGLPAQHRITPAAVGVKQEVPVGVCNGGAALKGKHGTRRADDRRARIEIKGSAYSKMPDIALFLGVCRPVEEQGQEGECNRLFFHRFSESV